MSLIALLQTTTAQTPTQTPVNPWDTYLRLGWYGLVLFVFFSLGLVVLKKLATEWADTLINRTKFYLGLDKPPSGYSVDVLDVQFEQTLITVNTSEPSESLRLSVQVHVTMANNEQMQSGDVVTVRVRPLKVTRGLGVMRLKHGKKLEPVNFASQQLVTRTPDQTEFHFDGLQFNSRTGSSGMCGIRFEYRPKNAFFVMRSAYAIYALNAPITHAGVTGASTRNELEPLAPDLPSEPVIELTKSDAEINETSGN